MPPLEPPTLLLLAAIGFALTTSILHTLARSMSEEQRVTELRSRTTELRKSYTKRLDELSGCEQVEPAAEADPAAPEPAFIKQAA